MVLLTQNLCFVEAFSSEIDSEIKALSMALMMSLFHCCVELCS